MHSKDTWRDTPMSESFNVKNQIITLAGCLYFVAMTLLTQNESLPLQLFWYASILFGAAVTCVVNLHMFKRNVVLFLLMFAATGVANHFIIGSISIKPFALMFIQFFIALLFLNKRFDYKALLAIVLLNGGIIMLKFLTVGFWGDLYINSSNNFVSVYMLYPTVLYYCLAEDRNEKPYFWPVAFLWIMSLLSRGRGGIIASTFLFVGIFYVMYRKKNRDVRALFLIVFFIFVAAVAVNIDRIINMIDSSMISETFRDRGMNSSRMFLWKDYLKLTFSEKKYLIFGADIHKTLAWERYTGNSHNSYINIHTYNGLICFVYVMVILVKNVIQTIRYKRPFYFFCLGTFLFRAFTDNVFWMTYGTVTLFVMLFLFSVPEKISKNKEVKEFN